MTVTTFPAPSKGRDSAGIVARNLKRLMAERGVPQRQLAEVLGVTQSNVSKRLKGRTPFTTDDLDALARAFEVRPGDLLNEAGQNTSTPAAQRSEGDELPRRDSNLQPAGSRISLLDRWLRPHSSGHRVVGFRTGTRRGSREYRHLQPVQDHHTYGHILEDSERAAA